MAPAVHSQTVTVGGRTLKLTNLDKVLYPQTQTTKADVIAYYAGVAEVMLPHLSRRPATRKRWPDGVGEPGSEPTVFFNKGLAAGTPDWVARHEISHREHDSLYPLVDDLATLTWLAQLAALELHVPQWRFGRDGQRRHPDRLVLDFDPGDGVSLVECAEVARWAREILTDIGHPPVPVTSGSKGIHLYAALDGTLDAEQTSQVARELARALEAEHRDTVTSTMKRSERDGKVFIDWSQNAAAKTTVSPYSLRGRARPTVAAPRTWDELADPDLAQLTHTEVLDRVSAGIDPFAVIPADRVAAEPDRLATYRSMRDAARTPEPVPAAPHADTSTFQQDDAALGQDEPTPGSVAPIFVIQEHHARALHHDVRLEHDGVLVSWAVPKGPPPDGSANHLAVQTEDHPMEYADFAGSIPRGEYGGGNVTIWDRGTYLLHKWRDGKEVIATLFGRPGGGLDGVAKFALIHTGGRGRGDRSWLMHRMELDPADLAAAPAPTGPATQPATESAADPELPSSIAPMRAGAGTLARLGTEDWTFEMDWRGDRVTAYLVAGTARIFGTGGADLTDRIPSIAAALRAATDGPLGAGGVLDGVLVGGGTLVLFDLMRVGRRSLLREPYALRRETLAALLTDGADGCCRSRPGSTPITTPRCRRLVISGSTASWPRRTDRPTSRVAPRGPGCGSRLDERQPARAGGQGGRRRHPLAVGRVDPRHHAAGLGVHLDVARRGWSWSSEPWSGRTRPCCREHPCRCGSPPSPRDRRRRT